jgi:16S rRNA (guanine527-N7)-methyltransferase
MKGVYPRDEIERMPGGFRVVNVVRLVVPGLDAERHLVIVGARA